MAIRRGRGRAGLRVGWAGGYWVHREGRLLGRGAWLRVSVVWVWLGVLQVSFSNVCVWFLHPALECQWGRKEVT